jgi:hypothetical protein
MIEFDENIQGLLNQCNDISVEIQVKETWSDDIDHPIIEINTVTDEVTDECYTKLWDFDLIFNNDFKVDGTTPTYSNQKVFDDYRKFIEERKKKAYQEIDNLLISDNSLFEKKNQISSIKITLEELVGNYHFISEDKRSQYFKLLDNKKICRSLSENKVINKLFEKQVVDPFLRIQKEAIENTLKFIEGKMQLLEKSQSENVNEYSIDNVIMNGKNNFRKIKFSDDINLLVTLFYDLRKEGYIISETANLERFLLSAFIDKNGNSLNKETIHTLLKPSKEDKRALNDKRIQIPSKK